MHLRDYQQHSNDLTFQWFYDNPTGNLCIEAPWGAGKSHMIAGICKTACQSWPDTRILMLTHDKKLVSQNAGKLREHWPNAPLGIYSAGLKRREIEPITYANYLSVLKRTKELGHRDLVIVDECHLISHKEEGGYRKIINELTEINPALRVLGYSATPYRLGHGLITDGDALFDDIIKPITIQELIAQGYLAPLRSKQAKKLLNVDGVKKSGGDYVVKELEKAVDTDEQNDYVVREIIKFAEDRRHWLVFCTGIHHCEAIAQLLNDYGIPAAFVHSKMQKAQERQIQSDFERGKYRALVNVAMYTTGYDFPDIDLIAMVRPTESAALYGQIAGRGLRVKRHTDHCLFLDFAGVVRTHGPITDIRPPKTKGSGEGTAPIRVCDECGEICHAAARECTHCGHLFPEPEKKSLSLDYDADIMGEYLNEMHTLNVKDWSWSVQQSKSNGRDMFKINYYGQYYSDPPVTEYLCVMHDSGIAKKHMRILNYLCTNSKVDVMAHSTMEGLAEALNESPPPAEVEYKKNGKYQDVKRRVYLLKNPTALKLPIDNNNTGAIIRVSKD